MVPLHICMLTLVWPSHLLFVFSYSSASLPPSSGPVCHQRGVFRWCDGAPDADPDSRRLHAVCRGFLQRLWALHGRRYKEREATRRRQQRWRRQEEFWESLWQGWGLKRIFINIKQCWLNLLRFIKWYSPQHDFWYCFFSIVGSYLCSRFMQRSLCL